MEKDWEEVIRMEDKDKMMKYAKYSRILSTKVNAFCYSLIAIYATTRCLSMRTEGRLYFFPSNVHSSGYFPGDVDPSRVRTTFKATKRSDPLEYRDEKKLSNAVKLHRGETQSFEQLMVDDGEQMPVLELFFFTFYIVYVLLQLYLYCYVGEQLWFESTELARAAYECKWYELLPNEARTLLLIIHRSRSPLRLTAGKFCILNHELYSTVLKTSMSYLSVLRATITKDE
ncbi:hypothetical protein HZH68_004876 [Vespula germanica]|uniref:Uncharacterized protein n=1 Tax=Vespula germanica TaxID=30212 RepID=A0A834NIQ2_VESGE|nr:hypothetical protein HZH68_004876 [Vespula germanica]